MFRRNACEYVSGEYRICTWCAQVLELENKATIAQTHREEMRVATVINQDEQQSTIDIQRDFIKKQHDKCVKSFEDFCRHLLLNSLPLCLNQD